MKLKARDTGLSTEGPLVAIVNEEDALKLDLHALDRIRIIKDKRSVIATIDIAKSTSLSSGEIGLFKEVLDKLNIKDKESVEVYLEKKPESITYIRDKLKGKRLTAEQINEIVKDIVENELSEIELTFFVAACYMNELDMNEIVNLTNAIAKNGNTLNLKSKIILDKHGSGGTPGNRTTMIIVPIIAAAGLTMPKTSSRAISSAAGTADVMEVLANVSFSATEIQKIVEKTNGCIVWSGAVDMASADDRLIKIEYPLSLDPKGILLSSILAKKKAVNATHVLIDISYGEGAKFENKRDVLELRKRFIKLGRALGMKINVILTDGSQPIGNGIGPTLEARDVLWILQNNKKAPKDLKEKSVKMAGLLLNMVNKGSEKEALQILESGKAYTKMKEIIKAQGGNPDIKPEDIKIGRYSYIVKSKKTGIIKKINNNAIIKIARLAGAPKDKEAGVYLYAHKGDQVMKEEPLFAVYSNNKQKLGYTIEVFNKGKVIEIA